MGRAQYRGCPCARGSAPALPRTTDTVVLGEYDQETASSDVQRLGIAKVRPVWGCVRASAVLSAGSAAGMGAPRSRGWVPSRSSFPSVSGLASPQSPSRWCWVPLVPW